jgi:uracil-DNA glycosylase
VDPGEELARSIPPAWRAALATELHDLAFSSLATFLKSERARHEVFPAADRYFAALADAAPHEVKAVLIGQDPYPTPGNANGLAFSVAPGMKVPASLKNIYRALELDLGQPPPKSGDLTPWARAGVLLINTVLSVRRGEPGSHRKKGWEPLTGAILREVARQPGPIVFLALGTHAKMQLENLELSRHQVIAMPHPSPLNGKAFVEAAETVRPFSRTNQLLAAGGRSPIEWRL